jgi:hypothetical protein
VSRFAYTYEDPEYEISEELLDEQPEEEVEDEEIYSPYHGA